MTPKRAKELLPLIEAFSKGAEIQFQEYKEQNLWKTTSNPVWGDDVQYRIKLQQARVWLNKYDNTFKCATEQAWNKIENYQSFGGWKSEPFDLIE